MLPTICEKFCVTFQGVWFEVMLFRTLMSMERPRFAILLAKVCQYYVTSTTEKLSGHIFPITYFVYLLHEDIVVFSKCGPVVHEHNRKSLLINNTYYRYFVFVGFVLLLLDLKINQCLSVYSEH
jgi:hypothetical protein